MLSLTDVTNSGLTGRGGAHFPLARKIAAVCRFPGPRTLIVNAVEFDPFSAKDWFIATQYPAEVARGVALAASLIDASSIRVVAPQQSLAALAAHFPSYQLLEAPGGLLGGEASALVNFVNTGKALPTKPLVHATDLGYLVSNIETLYQLNRLDEGFSVTSRAFVSVSEGKGDPNVYQLDRPTYLRELAHGPVLMDGHHGYWLSESDNPLLHSGSVHTPEQSVFHTTSYLLSSAATASAKQCGPCLFGLPAISAAWDNGDFAEVCRLAPLLLNRGGCHHPDGTIRMALSALGLLERQ